MSDIAQLVPSEDSSLELAKERLKQTILSLNGEGIAIDDNVMMVARLETLVDFCVGAAIRPDFELAFYERCRHMIEERASAARQQRLLEGVRPKGMRPT